MDNDFGLQQIEQALTTRRLGRRLVYLPSAGSTNDVARELAAEGAPDGTTVVADEQWEGRGRLGRRWMAPPGTCLLYSILFRPSGLELAHAPHLTMLCALAAADMVRSVARLDVELKWPNDLVVRRTVTHQGGSTVPAWRKLAGLLTESGVTGMRLDYIIVGTGINVNVAPEQLPSLAPDATSILAETGLHVGRARLLASMLAEVERRYDGLLAGASPFAEWAARLALAGRPVQALTADGLLAGVAQGVDDEGALLLRTSDGRVHRLLATDVTLAAAT